MLERLFGIQIGGLWATVQMFEMLAVVLAIGWLLSKIELPDRGASQTNEREGK